MKHTIDFSALKQQLLTEWKELLSFPSVSSDADCRAACLACADWLVDWALAGGAAAASRIDTSGLPAAYAEFRGPPGAPTVLIYGHYDLQPPGDPSSWESDPFRPRVSEGRVFARGARDNKGQFFALLSAVRELRRLNALPCSVRVLIDGEEEIGSPNLSTLLDYVLERGGFDFALASETQGSSDGVPAITAGLRGGAASKIEVFGLPRDFHSGHFGGVLPNPAAELARLLASLHNDDGSVAIDGFYDDVKPPSEALAEEASKDPLSLREHLAEIGNLTTGGEAKFPIFERVGFRPTLEVNGLEAGYVGSAYKTIIPAKAVAAISMRVVPEQDPERLLKLLRDHLEQRIRPDLKVRLCDEISLCSAFHVDLGSPVLRLACDVISSIYKRKAELIWSGATVPVLSRLSERTDAPIVLVGFGTPFDCEHAPNESFPLVQFQRAFEFTASYLISFGKEDLSSA